MNLPITRPLAVTLSILLVAVVVIWVYRATDPTPYRSPDENLPKTAEQQVEKKVAQPTRLPDRIILTWKGEPTTTQAITWRTDVSVTTPVAQIALADAGPGVERGWQDYDPKKVGTFVARTEKLKTDINEASYHCVNIEGLTPSTRYMYRVGDGTIWSEWFQFDTASTKPEPFGFIYFGDAQNGIKTLWSRVARGAYSDMPKARFIIHAGDLVDRGNSDTEWGEWHTAAGWINGMVVSVPTPGNHEYAGPLTAHWRPQFTLPEHGPPGLEETCYYFDFQGTRIVSLNSNEKLAEQVPWLEGVLSQRPPTITWTVVTFHHPIYSTAKGRDNKQVRELWRPVFDKYGVDLVLQGHDHTYGRSGLLREDNLLTGTQIRTGKGTVYVISVSGAKMYTLETIPWANRTAANTQLYQLIRIDGNVLKYESRTARGDLYDSFELRKRPDGGNDMEEREVSPTTPSPIPEWPQSSKLAVGTSAGHMVVTTTDATASTTASGADSSETGSIAAAAVILGSVFLGVITALRQRKRTETPT